MRKVVISLVMLYACALNAQWRVGITAGADYNFYSADSHYMEGFGYKNAFGGTAGIMGQYDIKDWIGIRMDFNWMMKDYRRRFFSNGYSYVFNHYLQLPVMASISLGNDKCRGFLNLGWYGSYWLKKCSNILLLRENYSSDEYDYGIFSNDFDNQRDQRWGYGLVGGVGLDWHWAKHWGTQLEARIYYSLQSEQRDYMIIKDPKYNTTLVLSACIFYSF